MTQASKTQHTETLASIVEHYTSAIRTHQYEHANRMADQYRILTGRDVELDTGAERETRQRRV